MFVSTKSETTSDCLEFFVHCFRKLEWFKLVTTKLDLEIMTDDLCLPGQTEETERKKRNREREREKRKRQRKKENWIFDHLFSLTTE